MPELNVADHVLTSLKLQLPLILLVITGLVVLVMDVMLPAAQRWALALASIIGVIAAFVALDFVGAPAGDMNTFFGGLRSNYMIFLVENLILAAGAFVFLISPRYVEERPIPLGEYY